MLTTSSDHAGSLSREIVPTPSVGARTRLRLVVVSERRAKELGGGGWLVELGLSSLCLALYWAPLVLAGDYSATTDWTMGRTAGAALLIGLLIPGVIVVRSRCIARVRVAPVLVVASAALMAVSEYFASAWVDSGPLVIPLCCLVVAAIPFMVQKDQARWCLYSAACAGGVLAFWPTFFGL